MGVGTRPYNWPAGTEFALWGLDVVDRDCPACGHMMYLFDPRYRRIHTLVWHVLRNSILSEMDPINATIILFTRVNGVFFFRSRKRGTKSSKRR